MSGITKRILESIDYSDISKKRRNNFEIAHYFLKGINRLNLNLSITPFTYPLLVENGEYLKKKLIEQKIYIPTYWYEVLERNGISNVEKMLVENMICIPIDQRVGEREIRHIVEIITQCL